MTNIEILKNRYGEDNEHSMCLFLSCIEIGDMELAEKAAEIVIDVQDKGKMTEETYEKYMAIRQQTTKSPTLPWINVTDRLPEKDDNVLIIWGHGNIDKCRFFQDDNGEMVWKVPTYTNREAYLYPLDFATHWMPLPKPPQNGE